MHRQQAGWGRPRFQPDDDSRRGKSLRQWVFVKGLALSRARREGRRHLARLRFELRAPRLPRQVGLRFIQGPVGRRDLRQVLADRAQVGPGDNRRVDVAAVAERTILRGGGRPAELDRSALS